jgi:RNA polymerase sigma-70 factor (ECF subfamily)
MTASPGFKDKLVGEMPALRAFAISLSGRTDRADDLVQETLLKSWAARDSFTEGTNLRAWLFTILRNVYFSEHRKRRREVEDPDGHHAESLTSIGGQQANLDLQDLRAALLKMPADQREVLLLVGATGFSYEQAAEICGVAVGTIKSRVNRARARLTELMGIESVEDFGADPIGRVTSVHGASRAARG